MREERGEKGEERGERREEERARAINQGKPILVIYVRIE